VGKPESSSVSSASKHTGFVGRSRCVECHEIQHDLWLDSHHDNAMQLPTPDTVLGDFSGSTFTKDGVTSRFFRDGEKFLVETDNAAGELEVFEVAYTFGVDPLQQYLIEFPDGRLQVLGVCWDIRPASENGQRWFHLYEDDPVPHDDILHWTGNYQNWNFMCAECHSTDLKKGYDFASDTFKTTWSEIDVSCEACHGSGSEHVEWAEAYKAGTAAPSDTFGFLMSLKKDVAAEWIMNLETGTAVRTPERTTHAEVETCALCHSRRGLMSEDYVPGQPLLNTHQLQLLEDPIYYHDGQIRDEDYVYGSFLQSKMYHAGVTCSDCHDPHTARTRLPANALCSVCHLPSKYAAPTHHFHESTSTGASCVECHMPERTYMVVDPRRDHSIRVPRPDLSDKLGTPNACTQCHSDQTNAWAAKQVAEWFPDSKRRPHFGEAFALARSGNPRGESALLALLHEAETPDIVRASALSELANTPTRESVAAAIDALADGNPLVRSAALRLAQFLPAQERFGHVGPLLNDPIGVVRHEASRTLADTPLNQLNTEQSAALDTAIETYIQTELTNADRPEAHLNIAIVQALRGDLAAAERAGLKALEIEPQLLQTRLNLASIYQQMNRDGDGEKVLREGLKLAPEAGILRHTLGLLLYRQGRQEEALDALRRAAADAPEEGRFQYVYAIALNSLGAPRKALDVLREASPKHPFDREILLALITMNLEQGSQVEAESYFKRFETLWPDAPEIQAFTNTFNTLELNQ
jgi:Tfp pilus assembly protein PilF